MITILAKLMCTMPTGTIQSTKYYGYKTNKTTDADGLNQKLIPGA